MPLMGVGIDVVDVGRVDRLLRPGSRFPERWFTPTESAACWGSDEPAQSFAALLAAKEAIWKSLGLNWAAGIPWRQIEVLCSLGKASAGFEGEVARVVAISGVSHTVVDTTLDPELALAVAFSYG